MCILPLTTVTMPVATSGVVHASIRLLLFIFWTLLTVPIIAVGRALGFRTAGWRRIYFHILCRIFGLDVVHHGHLASERPLLIASNHISYLDILVFGSVFEVEFVSKAEVADWPVFGTMARIGDTVFIERRRSRTARARDDMAKRLSDHRSLIFFPEATSGNGNRLLPYKSALFTLAESLSTGKKITLQPAAIAYTRLNGLPVGCGWRPFFAWYGDMGMFSHLWRFLQLGRTTAEIALLDPLTAGTNISRKTLAAEAEKVSRAAFNQLISGRILF